MPSSTLCVDATSVPRMPLSDDVLRGLRWGAILLAGLAIGVAWYRLVRESPPKPAHKTSKPAPILSGTPDEKSGSLPSSKTIDKPAEKRSGLTSGSRPVPPPPARGAKPVSANPPRGGSGDAALTGEPASKNQDDSVTDEKTTGPSAGPADDKDADRSGGEKADPAESSGPGALGESAAKQEARGKRWIKTVGKWLGIGRKDPSPQ
jgi:hypothetical protein